MREWHEKLDFFLSEVLPVDYHWHVPIEPDYVDAANACRDVRERMNRHPCQAYTDFDDMCIYNLLLPTLDALQRRAYEEIRLKVDIATATRLPTELSFLIFERAMAAEEVPLDPRIFVNAKHKDREQHGDARKTRFVCPHWQKSGKKLCIVPERPRLTWGDDWIEKKPNYWHHNAVLRYLENDKYQWHRFGEKYGGDVYDDSMTEDEDEDDMGRNRNSAV